MRRINPLCEVLRKIHELPTAIVVLSHDQYYPGYTLVIAKTRRTELHHLPDNESTQYCQDMLRVAEAVDRLPTTEDEL